MKASRRPTVLVASGDRLFLEAAAAYIEREAGWRVAGTATDGLQALSVMGRAPAQAVLVLRHLPRLGPAALARQIHRRWPGTQVAILGHTRAPDATVLPETADAEAVLEALTSRPPAVAEDRGRPEPDGVVLLARLTPRERVTLKLLAEGRTMREIAGSLGVSEHTVRTHMQNLYAKLGVHNRLELVRFAAIHGLVGAEDGGPGS